VKLRFFVVSGDHRLRVFGNRKVFEPKREVLTGEWRALHQVLYG